VVNIASTEAPNKRPDLTTAEGKNVVRGELDALHDLFVDAIGRGRKNATGEAFSAERINANFGRGGVLLAKEAKENGLIDQTAKAVRRGTAKAAEAEGEELPPTPEPSAAETENDPGVEPEQPQAAPRQESEPPMDIKELKAKHPELFAQVQEEAATAATTAERKRVSAHLKLGKASGAMDVALAAIASGVSTLDEEVHASYQAAQMNRGATQTRQTESDGAGAAVDGAAAAAGESGKDLGDKVADLMDAARGAPVKKAS
jgi:ClpP class serine protease